MAKKQQIVFGVDEVGRGCLAGSVFACAITKLKMKNEKLKTTKKKPSLLKRGAVCAFLGGILYFCVLVLPYFLI